MKLVDFLHDNRVIATLESKTKKGVIEELAQSVAATVNIPAVDISKVLLEREQLGSTGIGGGIAIPHGKLKSIDTIVLGFGKSDNGIPYDSLDNKPVFIFFLLLTPENSTGGHLRVLAQISKLLKNSQFKKNLMNASTTDDIMTIVKDVDEDF